MRPGRGSRHCRHHYSRVPREAPAPIRPLGGHFDCVRSTSGHKPRRVTETFWSASRLTGLRQMTGTHPLQPPARPAGQPGCR